MNFISISMPSLYCSWPQKWKEQTLLLLLGKSSGNTVLASKRLLLDLSLRELIPCLFNVADTALELHAFLLLLLLRWGSFRGVCKAKNQRFNSWFVGRRLGRPLGSGGHFGLLLWRLYFQGFGRSRICDRRSVFFFSSSQSSLFFLCQLSTLLL